MSSSIQLVMEANSKLLASAKVMNPQGCSLDVDRHIQKTVLILKGTVSETSVRLPREDRPSSSLRLHDSLLVAQLCLDVLSHFAIEIVVSQGGVRRTKLVIGTHVKVARYDDSSADFTAAYLPLIIPRNKWVQVIFHIAGIVQSVFNLPPCKYIDMIAVAGSGKMCCLCTSSDEQACIDATPESMALFAVPAYAPPIWKSAAAVADDAPTLPSLEAAQSAPPADILAPLRRASFSLSLTPSPPPAHEKPDGHPVRLQPLVAAPPSEFAQKYNRSSSAAEAPRGNAKSDYIRIVEDEYSPFGDESLPGRSGYGEGCSQSAPPESGARRIPGNGVRGAADNTAGCLSGWEQSLDDRKPEVVAAQPGRPGKLEPPRRPQRRSVSGQPGVGPTDNERMQRIVAARKRQVSPRQTNGAVGGARGRSTGSRRQQRLRRRMRVLRANEQKVNKAAAAKTLAASDIPLSQQVELQDDPLGMTPTSLSDTPFCGFGFGYLGVLKANGEYEEDEDANLNLRGALTLNSDNE